MYLGGMTTMIEEKGKVFTLNWLTITLFILRTIYRISLEVKTLNRAIEFDRFQDDSLD